MEEINKRYFPQEVLDYDSRKDPSYIPPNDEEYSSSDSDKDESTYYSEDSDTKMFASSSESGDAESSESEIDEEYTKFMSNTVEYRNKLECIYGLNFDDMFLLSLFKKSLLISLYNKNEEVEKEIYKLEKDEDVRIIISLFLLYISPYQTSSYQDSKSLERFEQISKNASLFIDHKVPMLNEAYPFEYHQNHQISNFITNHFTIGTNDYIYSFIDTFLSLLHKN